jgi:hypothetical protein
VGALLWLVQKRFDGDVQLVNRTRRFHKEGTLMKARPSPDERPAEH